MALRAFSGIQAHGTAFGQYRIHMVMDTPRRTLWRVVRPSLAWRVRHDLDVAHCVPDCHAADKEGGRVKDSDTVPTLSAMPADVSAGRFPTWRMDSLTHRSCPVCGADSPTAICRRPDLLLVGKCSACGMTYLPDTPTQGDLRKFYANYSTFKGRGPLDLS